MKNNNFMNFEEFKEYCVEHLLLALPEGYEDATINVNTVQKNNGKTLTALTVLRKDKNVAPNIYLEGFYMDYERGKFLDEIIHEIADILRNSVQQSEEFYNIVKSFENVNFIKDKVIVELVNREKNAELLNDIPYSIREDLALIYKVMIENREGERATILIHNNHLKNWGISAEELHEWAVTNTKELLPVKVKSMDNMLEEFIDFGDMDEDEKEYIKGEPEGLLMWVVTNRYNQNGAVSIFFDNVLDKLAEMFNTDIYILPSSIHEVIVVSSIIKSAEDLALMVKDINRTELKPEEILSDHVYFYGKEEKIFKIAA